ncbi:MAG: CDP-alcohol phosphatidyltransferase family protein [Verrucomicrobiae bacterium]|nr:CDP-alcohol phosphatidyltransferase family protein [Verrucomicrobiae bacterium]
MTLANYITLFRILMIPVFVTLTVYYKLPVEQGGGQTWMIITSFFVYGLAALSDGIDGYIARRYHQISNLGKVLDPVADKFLQFSGILVLSYQGSQDMDMFPLWFVIFFFSREVGLLGGYLIIQHFNQKVRVVPHWTGKTSTALLMVLIGLMLLDLPWFRFEWMLGVVMIFIVYSTIYYIRDAILQLKEGGQAGI